MPLDPLLLIPPMLCDARVFAPQINHLSTVLPVMVAPTTCGERMEEIASQILGWAPARFALAGAGMGGAVALEIMRRAPERVQRLALIAASHHGETPEAASAREPMIVAARSGRFDDVIAQEMDPECLASGAKRLEVGRLLTDMARTIGPDRFVRQARAMQRRRDQQATLRKVTQPALVIGGADDPRLPPKRHAFMAELIPGGQLEIVAGAGHMPTLERPAAVSDLLYDWMNAPLVLR